jgi:adenylate cyclase
VFLIYFSVGLIAALAAVWPGMAALEEAYGLHLLFALRGARPSPPSVAVVALDRQSSRKLDLPMEPRRWPRSVHARLVERLTAAGAALIVFDLIFNEPQTPEEDQALAAAIRAAGNVILAQSVVDDAIAVEEKSGAPPVAVEMEKTVPPIALLVEASLAQAPFPLPKVPVKLSRYWTFKPGADETPTIPTTTLYALSRAVLEDFFALLNRDTPPEKRISPAAPLGEAIRAVEARFLREPGLAERLAAALQNTPAPLPAETQKRIRALIRLHTEDTASHLNFYGPAGTVATIPYHRVMEDNGPGALPVDLRSRVVFVGQTESYWPKAKDGFHTVYARTEALDISGVEIGATALANLLDETPVTPTPPVWRLAIAGFWALLLLFFCRRLSIRAAAGAVLSAGAIYLLVAAWRFAAAGAWYPVVLPLAILAPGIYFTALAVGYRRVSRERRDIRRAFGYFLPNRVVDRISKDIQAIAAERHMVYAICMFCDAERYTHVSEQLDPPSLTALMNRYYAAIFKPIRDHGGTILQVVGDSVLSLWTAPQGDARLRASACAAALGVAEAVTEFNRRPGGHALPTRIGLHAGEILLGNIGALDHFEYRPVGDIVNTASRLEGLNKQLGTRILVSDAVLEGVERFSARDVGRFVFVGKVNAVGAFELRGPAGEAAASEKAALADFARALATFQGGEWARAATLFSKVMEQMKQDGPCQFYLNRCNNYSQSPPEQSWNGIIYLDRK